MSSKSSPLAGQKRSRSPSADQFSLKIQNEYNGYVFGNDASSPPDSTLQLDTVDAKNTTPAQFFEKYISKRRPCILTNLLDEQHQALTAETLRAVAGDVPCQIEKRPTTDHLFGQNRTAQLQVVLTIREFLDRLQEKDSTSGSNRSKELYYLSTQEESDSPCAELRAAGHLPATIPLAGNLQLQTCNLWMGASGSKSMKSSASASGLHHDFADNFYLLFRGQKEFRIYAPGEARHMQVYGRIERIHANGLISYCNNPTFADGYPVGADDDDDNDDDEEEVVLGKGFDYKSDSENGDAVDFDGTDDYEALVGDENDDYSEDSEEEAVIGKGADYKSDDEGEQVGFEGDDDYDVLVGNASMDDKKKEAHSGGAQPTIRENDDKSDEGNDGKAVLGNGADYRSDSGDEKFLSKGQDDYDTLEEMAPANGKDKTAIGERARPDHFSPLSPSDLPSCQECVVTLKAGQSLYLPASWFHHVTSACGDSPYHLAVNYWYHPPDQLDNFENPYQNARHWARK